MAAHIPIQKKNISKLVQKLKNPEIIDFIGKAKTWESKVFDDISLEKLPQEYVFENDDFVPFSVQVDKLSNYITDKDFLDEPYLDDGSLEVHFTRKGEIVNIFVIL